MLNNLSQNTQYRTPIPSPSTSLHPSLASSTKSQEEMYKIMCMMRQQIEIANSFYTDKIKAMLSGQAKEIGRLRELLVQNQRELIKKNCVINQLKQERETPKKKISVVSSQPQVMQAGENLAVVMERIGKLQARLSGLQANVAQKHEAQRILNNKLENIEKGTLKYLATKLGSCSSKLDKYLIKKQKQLQKLYADSLNLLRPPQNLDSPSNTKLSAVHRELTSLRQQISILKNKQYRYDSSEVQKLRGEITRMRKWIGEQENRNRIDNERRFESEKLIHNNSLNGSTSQQPAINKVRSEKIIQFNDPKSASSTLYYTKNGTACNRNMVPVAKINLNPSQNQNQPKPREIEASQNLMLNYSTPTLLRNYSDASNFSQNSQKVIDRNGRLFPNNSDNRNQNLQPQLAHQLTKTGHLSTQASRSTKPAPSSCSPLQHEFYEPSPQQSLQYQPDSECESYEQQPEPEQPDLEQRLISTIREQGLRMPVLVQVDQTGCLKCVDTGMYLVDGNCDVFYLGEGDMRGFVAKGVLRVQ